MNAYAEAKGPLITTILGRAEEWATRPGWTVQSVPRDRKCSLPHLYKRDSEIWSDR